MLHHVIRGAGRPLVVIHGARLDHRHMVEAVEPVFAGRDGWQRVYIDLPGHGKSPPQARIASQDDLLAAVAEGLDDILPDGRFAVLGESRGSSMAAGLAQIRPERVAGLALIVPGGSPNADPARLPRHEVLAPDPALRAGLAPDEVPRFDGVMVVQTRDIVDKTRRTKLPALALHDADQEARIAGNFDFSFDTQGARAVFRGPCLLVAGRQDSLSGYRDAIDLLDTYPRATLAVLDTAGHGLSWERPSLFAALVTDWLDRLA